MCLSGDRFPADLAPVQELLLQIALGIQLAGVDQVGDEQGLFCLGHGATPSKRFFFPAGLLPTTSITLTGPAQPFGPAPPGPAGLQFAPKSRTRTAVQSTPLPRDTPPGPARTPGPFPRSGDRRSHHPAANAWRRGGRSGGFAAIGIEPPWKPPLGHRATRLRQDQPLIESGEHPRSRGGQAIAQVQLVGRHVQRVPRVATPAEVTVMPRPVEPSITPYLIHPASRFNPEPTPPDVLLRFASDQPPTFPGLLRPPEEAEEQEHIPGPHALLLQMPLRSAGLSEYAPTSVVPPDGILPDIGIHRTSGSRRTPSRASRRPRVRSSTTCPVLTLP